MPILDTPIELWIADGVLNDQGTAFNWTWSKTEGLWAQVIDGGSSWVPGDTSITYTAQFMIRWGILANTVRVNDIAIVVLDDGTEAPSDTMNAQRPEFGNSWAVYNRQVLDQADRRRFLVLEAARLGVPLTH